MSTHLFATKKLSLEDYHALVIFTATTILQTIAWEEIHRNGRQPGDFVLYCVEENPTSDILISGASTREEWWRVQSPALNPVFYGVVTLESFGEFVKILPEEAKRILMEPVAEGCVKAIIYTRAAIESMQIAPNNFGRSH